MEKGLEAHAWHLEEGTANVLAQCHQVLRAAGAGLGSDEDMERLGASACLASPSVTLCASHVRSHDEVQLAWSISDSFSLATNFSSEVAAAYKLGRSVDRTWLALLCALTGGSEAASQAFVKVPTTFDSSTHSGVF